MIEAVEAPAPTPTPEELAEAYAVRVLRFATLLCRNPADAEDLAQEAMIKALRGLSSYRAGPAGIEAWLWRIVVNAAGDAGRMARRGDALWDRLRSYGRAEVIVEDTESLALRRMNDAQLAARVRLLPRRQQTLIALRYGAGLSYQEMADLLGQRPATLRQGVHRALSGLRARIEQEERA
jgi:RNA polymerase sigma-70 factor (ECF subfamily)